MSCVRIIDTSVLCNLLRVPEMDQDAGRARDEFRVAQEARDVFLLPVAVIYETGNHIAHVGDGNRRRIVAAAFVELVRRAFEGDFPFVPTPLQNSEEMVAWLGEFPDCATRGMEWDSWTYRSQRSGRSSANSIRVVAWSSGLMTDTCMDTIADRGSNPAYHGPYRGKASRTPPSTGSMAPVVREERSEARKRTASATSSARTSTPSRLRLR